MVKTALALEPKRLVILGATGSIGKSTAAVVEEAGCFGVEAVAGGSDGAALATMAIRLKARFAAIADPSAYVALKAGLSGTGIEAAAGREAVIAAALHPSDLVLAAIAGTAGVAATFAAAAAGRNIALANKECLVCAGTAFMQAMRLGGGHLLPVDSEHNAIFQALGGNDASRIEKMTLTASGGPFRLWSVQAIATATPADALAHPNWSMGRKVSIDSATLMNKGLELVEAHHLFQIEATRLEVLVHPQSIVHGMVTHVDGSVVACLAAPDMRTPIAHCLSWPDRVKVSVPKLDLAKTGTLTFEKPDLQRFPALALALECLRAGGAMPTVMNAANEVAVEAFLGGEIAFGDIARIVGMVCDRAASERTNSSPGTVEEAMAINDVSRERAVTLLAQKR